MATPFQISVVMHYYVSPTHYDGPESESSIQTTKGELALAGLLNIVEGKTYDYEVTKAGQVFCEALIDVPFPVKIWVIPEKDD